MIIRKLRSLFFDLVFYPSTFLILVTGSLFGWGPRWMTGWVYPLHSYMTTFLLRWIVGIKQQVEGLENIPDGPILVASKHQSAWDTFIFGQYIKKPAIVHKKDLLWVLPLGVILWHQQMIPVARGQGRAALKGIIAAARRAVTQNRSIIIFPEGRRLPPDHKTKCQSGIAILYEALKVPVVPVALNSGYFWGRRQFFKKPGTITLRFLPAIAPGLDKTEFLRELETSIESACEDIKPT